MQEASQIIKIQKRRRTECLGTAFASELLLIERFKGLVLFIYSFENIILVYRGVLTLSVVSFLLNDIKQTHLTIRLKIRVPNCLNVIPNLLRLELHFNQVSDQARHIAIVNISRKYFKFICIYINAASPILSSIKWITSNINESSINPRAKQNVHHDANKQYPLLYNKKKNTKPTRTNEPNLPPIEPARNAYPRNSTIPEAQPSIAAIIGEGK